MRYSTAAARARQAPGQVQTHLDSRGAWLVSVPRRCGHVDLVGVDHPTARTHAERQDINCLWCQAVDREVEFGH